MDNIKLSKKDVSRYVILTGSPERVVIIAEKLTNSKKIAQNREFVSYTGFFGDVEILVISTGIGSPSAAIAIEELTELGADTFIRVGTSGSLQEWVAVGDLIIATGAVRDEGTTPQYVPMYYPAIAHYEVVNALIASSEKLSVKPQIGIIHTKDSLRQETPEGVPLERAIREKWDILRRSQVLCTEMESSALFVIGSIKKVRVGSVIVSAGLTYKGIPDINTIETENGISNAIDLAISAIGVLANNDRRELKSNG